MLRLMVSSRQKLMKVRAQSTEEMFQHCSWEDWVEKEQSMFQVQKLVQRSSLNRRGKTMYCDYSVNFGLMADEGMVKLSHLDPLSLAITNLVTGTSHFFLSQDTSIGLSQYLFPFLYPLAFCYQKPPICILISFPPGVVQKLTTSSLKQSPVFYLISWQNLFSASCGPSVMMPLVKGMYFSTFLRWERSSSTL